MQELEVVNHCREINRCNQRGGRMLSIFDLIERGTIDINLASFSLYYISQGYSFLVGANPGGAGKTTVMGALLNLIPPGIDLYPATEDVITEALKKHYSKKSCFICHEIGSGHWFAYLWGTNLKNYFKLLDYGHILASNLHADDIDEAYSQICIENRIPLEYFRKINLMYFIKILPGYRRIINKVYLSEGTYEHTLIYDYDSNKNIIERHINDFDFYHKCQEFIDQKLATIRTIEDTRRAVIEFLRNNSKKS